MEELQPVSFKYVEETKKLVNYNEEWDGVRSQWGDNFDDLLQKIVDGKANEIDWNEQFDGTDPDREEASSVLHGELGDCEYMPHRRWLEVTWQDGTVTEVTLPCQLY
jgi:hypothetical protein